MKEWLYYSCRWKSSQKNFVADFIRLNLNFIKKQKMLFEPHFGDLGVTYASIARWKARDRLPIRRNRTFFAISYG